MLESPFRERLQQEQPRLLSLLQRFAQVRVLVVGDLTLDEFLTGQVERLSREAPVLILRHEETQQVPGGGANAVYNCAKLGAQVKAVGLVGNDSQGRALRRIFETAGIDTQGILVESERPTVTKTRISGHARQSVTQQIVRIDRKCEAPPLATLQSQLADYICQQISQVDAILCSDYGDGVLSTPVIAAVLDHPQVMVDAQVDLPRYRAATLFTPNLPEAEKAVGYAIDSETCLLQAGQDLLAQTEAKAILITRGEQGMSLFEHNGMVEHIPAFNRTDVFDVTGAGDTVVTTITLALVAGATLWEATVLGNLAASIVVRQFGTATTSTAELAQALERLLEEEE
jgi:D-glycero-beta-D-manno-heptose-7-phosphate kinase